MFPNVPGIKLINKLARLTLSCVSFCSAAAERTVVHVSYLTEIESQFSLDSTYPFSYSPRDITRW
jgi:hypothetical protein